MANVALYWFANDLRMHDNASLHQAAQQADKLLCVYCVDPRWFAPNRHTHNRIANHRWRFLVESLRALDARLRKHDQHLLIAYQQPLDAIAQLITQHDVARVYRSRTADYYLNRDWQTLAQRYPMLQFVQQDSHTLFDLDDLPFELRDLPATYTDFRKTVEHLPLPQPLPAPDYLPPAPRGSALTDADLPPLQNSDTTFSGGEIAALKHISWYFAEQLASNYKEVRNALEGWENSTKLSPWLANGSLSARYIMQQLRAYEQQFSANKSTYWIYFELLWRDYFQWYAHCHAKHLFLFSGGKRRKPSTGYYPERYRKWCAGNTPYPIVNACMKQLNATGYMANRGRQIVASCLVNELDSDWRGGAAYFEQQLIDYDVANNWGNWQYLAGVGPDPRGKRHFDLEKQTKQYDPDGVFIQKWEGHLGDQQLDSVDAADWPIMPDQ